MTIIGIMLSVALITSVANLYTSAKESLIMHIKSKTGDFHYAYFELSEKEVDKLRQNRDVEEVFIEDGIVYVRCTKEALKEDNAVWKADASNDELIDLERSSLFQDNPQTNTLNKCVIIVICMIMLTSIMCIKSSFDISISERIKQYGMYASIGATKVQIRKNVYFEAVILALIGIPLGLLLGIIASYSIMRVCDTVFADILVFDLIYSFSWIAMAVAIFLSILTIYFSANQSARKASKVTPIQAIRSQNEIEMKCENYLTPKWISRYLGIGGEISYKNIERNREKYKTTMISLVICVALFIAVYSFTRIGVHQIEKQYIGKPYNLTIGYSGFDEKNKIAQYLKEIKELKDVLQVTYFNEKQSRVDSHKETEEYIEQIQERYVAGEYSGLYMNVLDDDSFKAYAETLQLEYEEVKSQGILLNQVYVENKVDESKVPYLDIEEGDIISGEVIKYDENNQAIYCPYKIPVAKIIDEIPRTHRTYGAAYLVMSESTYKQMIDEEAVEGQDVYRMEWVYIQSANPTKTEEELTLMLDEFVTERDTFYFNNLEVEEKEQRSFYILASVFMYSLIIVIAAIGITNMFNIVSANMSLRKREFAMLKSIGMTSREFNRMILLESIFYSRGALIAGIPLGIALSYLLYGMAEVKPYKIPYAAILLAFIVVLLLVGLIMKYSLGKYDDKNIIEIIRNENI